MQKCRLIELAPPTPLMGIVARLTQMRERLSETEDRCPETEAA